MDLNLAFKQYIAIEVKLFWYLMVILHCAPPALPSCVFSTKSKMTGENLD